jgi:hypothetical protein
MGRPNQRIPGAIVLSVTLAALLIGGTIARAGYGTVACCAGLKHNSVK